MLDVRAPRLVPEQGERLTREVYKRDFAALEAAVSDADSWKLERRQHFEELGSPSRDALRRGEWDEALRLLAERREALLATARDDARRGHRFHRVRVVQKPLTPYMQWELHSHRQRAQCGESIRVLDAGRLASEEIGGSLPEVVVLGGRVLFQVLYDDAGAAVGAIRYADRDIALNWAQYIKALHALGEDVITYVEREVAHLPPPCPRTE